MDATNLTIILIFIILVIVGIAIYAYERGIFTVKPVDGGEQPPLPPGFTGSESGEEQPPAPPV
jgi:hypothetical protein